MRDELATPAQAELLADVPVPNEITLELCERLVNLDTGPIISYAARNQFTAEYAEIYQYTTQYQDTTVFSDTGNADPLNTTGLATDEQAARLKALVEAIERYCFSLTNVDDFEKETVSELPAAVPPVQFLKFSDRQLEDRGLTREGIQNASYYWTAATDLIDDTEVLVPAHLVYLPFSATPEIRNPTSNGSAAHTSYAQAVLGGISEAIERECFIIHFLNRLAAPVLDPDTLDTPEFICYFRTLERQGYDITLLDISLDQPISTCLAVGHNTARNRMIDLGLGTGPTQQAAVTDAVRELRQISHWETTPNDDVSSPEDITTLVKRAEYWTDRDPSPDLEFWLNPESEPEPIDTTTTTPSPKDQLRTLLDWIDKNDYNCYVSEVTTDDVRQTGVKVIKALIPDLHPMYLLREYRYLGGDRLYTAPVKAGLRDTPRSEDELTTVPHPFL